MKPIVRIEVRNPPLFEDQSVRVSVKINGDLNFRYVSCGYCTGNYHKSLKLAFESCMKVIATHNLKACYYETKN